MQIKTMATVTKPNSFTRRQFLSRTALAAGVVTCSFPYVGRVLGANDRINVACIGVGGKGDSDSSDAANCGGNIVAICDVDTNQLAAKAKQFAEKFPQLKQYRDYRKMLDEMGKDIDAVTVSTPDHNHGVASLRAMKMGKHCFCQKPLVQTVYEARKMRQVAKEKKLATQMGNQGSAESGLRRAVEVVQAGVIGNPLEIHVWTNRPIWPQGLTARRARTRFRPTWIGMCGSVRPASGLSRRTSISRSNGAGGMILAPARWGTWPATPSTCLSAPASWAIPTSWSCEAASQIYPETFPKTSRIRFEFPAARRPAAPQVLVV